MWWLFSKPLYINNFRNSFAFNFRDSVVMYLKAGPEFNKTMCMNLAEAVHFGLAMALDTVQSSVGLHTHQLRLHFPLC